jgi:predicted ABC-type ATPase
MVGDRLKAPAEACDAYLAASMADALREEALASGENFAFETVMSHVSKVEFIERARVLGYRTYTYFVATDDPALNASRIETRVGLGGHAVPPEKVAERYERSLSLLRRATLASYRAYLFDNSGPRLVLIAERTPQSALILRVPKASVPRWVRRYAMNAD